MPGKRGSTKKTSKGGQSKDSRQTDRKQTPVNFVTVGDPVRIMKEGSETNFVEVSRKERQDAESGDVLGEYLMLNNGFYLREEDTDRVTDEARFNKGGVSVPLSGGPQQAGQLMDAIWDQLTEDEQAELDEEDD